MPEKGKGGEGKGGGERGGESRGVQYEKERDAHWRFEIKQLRKEKNLDVTRALFVP